MRLMNFVVHGFRFSMALLHPIAILRIDRSSQPSSICWMNAAFASSWTLLSSRRAFILTSLCAGLSLSYHFSSLQYTSHRPIELSQFPPSNYKMQFGISVHCMSSTNCFFFFPWILTLDLHCDICDLLFPSSLHHSICLCSKLTGQMCEPSPP